MIRRILILTLTLLCSIQPALTAAGKETAARTNAAGKSAEVAAAQTPASSATASPARRGAAATAAQSAPAQEVTKARAIAAPATTAAAQPNAAWTEGKYSMFIHFGLYSTLGGVWQGQQITRGYSEQIQAHAGIYGDQYERLADSFDPKEFDADAIVALAKRAGMRSIVITSKHHDGFCLFRTATTTFNSYDTSPCHRDIIAELSQACQRAGLRFGLYYSLIDWHHPGASNITSHNANPIPELHHKLNMDQVRELVTGYGPISELWFDMGSLTPAQSKDLYDLVHTYQPDCMVSGRLGNGQYDFAVMGDNFYPEAALQTAWQCPASMFDATWGYRSWQLRGEVSAKAREKLTSLIRVVAGGGNYLLNIGPTGQGAVVPWEAQVLETIGKWLSANGDAIYGCEGSPYREPFQWGGITRKGDKMNLILSGARPANDCITLPIAGAKLLSIEGPATANAGRGVITLKLSPEAYSGDIQVIRLTFDRPIQPEDATAIGERIAQSSYNCQDYYSNERSEVAYSWNLKSIGKNTRFIYTSGDIDRKLTLTVDGITSEISLPASNPQALPYQQVTISDRRWCRLLRHSFAMDGQYEFSEDTHPDCESVVIPWTETESERVTIEGRPFETVFLMANISSPCDQDIVLEVGAGNGVDLFVGGQSVMKHLNPYRTAFRSEKVLVSLKAGDNQVVLRSYNRNERTLEAMLRVADDQTIYSLPISFQPQNGNEGLLPAGEKLQLRQAAGYPQNGSEELRSDEAKRGKRLHTITISKTDRDSRHQDCELHNLRLKTK